MIFDINQQKVILERDGKKVECEVLFTFDSEDTGKSYVGYTDNKEASNGRKNIFVSSINPSNKEVELQDITDENELKMVYHVLQQLDSRVNG